MTITIHQFAKRVWNIAWHSDLHATRFLLGVAEIIWAVSLWMPGQNLASPVSHVMGSVMTEGVWGLIFMFSGVIQLSIIAASSYHSQCATWFSGWNAMLWIYLTLSMYVSGLVPLTAISGELSLAVGASWVFIRSGTQTKGKRSTDYGCGRSQGA